MNIHPFPYAIPDEYIVSNIPEKIRIFSEVLPTTSASNYLFKAGEEAQYIEQYRQSRFAHTKRKGGWDCLRHYEILAAGCIPVFEDLESCPKDTMVSFPKDLVLEACKNLLPWSDDKIELYNSYVLRLLDHCRINCSTSALAERFLKVFPNIQGSILMIQCRPDENYTRELLSIGLRRAKGKDFIDYPRIDVLYKDCDLSRTYGNGFTYGGHLDNIEIDRENIVKRILTKEFGLIIYGKVGRDEGPIPLWDLITSVYSHDKIALLYGGDGCQDLHDINSEYTQHLLAFGKICFVRELKNIDK